MTIYVLMIMITGQPYPVAEYTGKLECEIEARQYKFDNSQPNADLFCVER